MAIPVTLEDAKRQLRMVLADTTRDDEIRGFISDAAAWVESYTGHLFVAGDVTETFRGCGPATLRAWPIKGDAVAVVAGAINGVVATATTQLDISRGRARVSPGVGGWPFLPSGAAFTVTVRAGYEDGEQVPGKLRRAMLILIAAYDADREGGDLLAKAEDSARRQCSSYRVRRL